MSAKIIGNINNPPLNNVDGNYVNIDNSSYSARLSSNQVPSGPHTLPAPGNNIQSAAGIYKGGKIKISRKYKMKHSKRRRTRRHSRRKSFHKSRHSSRIRRHNRSRKLSRRHRMKGGAFQSPMTTPNYPAGHSQYQNNNGSLSNTYSLGGKLGADSSALANPPPYSKVAGDVDNLNHNTLNAYGNIGAGSGFPSRGWF